jgi:conjugal transfer pilus assembly protein TraI
MFSFFRKKTPPAPPPAVVPWNDDDEIPRYPPFMKGLPVVSPERLISTQAELVKNIRDTALATPEIFARHYMPAIQRFAGFVHLLPASQAHHHRGAGGLLRHALEVGLWALQAADKIMVRGAQSPAQRREMEPRWQLAVFLAALCHDAGKPITDVVITNEDRTSQWNPLTEGLHDWAKTNRLRAYYFDWRDGRGKQHTALSSLIGERIIGVESLAWIGSVETELVIWIMESLASNPGPTNQLHDLVVRADQTSVERDLKTFGAAMAGYDLGVPVERHLTDMMRRMVRENVWLVNVPGARVWNIGGAIYLVWPAAGEELARQAREDGVPGIPRTPDGILDMLVEREMAFLMEGENGAELWQIAPAVLAAKIPDIKLRAIRLRDDTLVSTMPLASSEGRVIGPEAAAPVVESKAVDVETNAAEGETTPVKVETKTPKGETAQGKATVPSDAANKKTGRTVRDTKSPPTIPEATAESAGSADKQEERASVSPGQEPQDGTPPVVRQVLFDGPTGEALKALAQDLTDGQDKRWGRDAVADKSGSVRLRWPAAFAGYGLSGKVLLEDMSTRGWLVTDPLNPLKKTVMARFADASDTQIAIQLSVEASAAFMALAGNGAVTLSQNHPQTGDSGGDAVMPEAAADAAPAKTETVAAESKPASVDVEAKPPKRKGAADVHEEAGAGKKGKRAKHDPEAQKQRPDNQPPAQAALPLAPVSNKSRRDGQECSTDAVIAALRTAPMTMDDETCVVAIKDALAAFEKAGLPIRKYQEIRRISAQSDGRLKVLPNAIKFKQ